MVNNKKPSNADEIIVFKKLTNFISKALKKSYIFKDEDPYSSHNRIAKQIILSKKNLILDVGCNQGFIGQALKKRGFKGGIIGLDKDKKHRSIVGKYNYSQFIQLDLETKELAKHNNKYEVIVLGDVLEHLAKPQKALAGLKKNLKKDGLFIISLPNIANIYIRLSLLLGKFEYSDRGILDQNHKRFYTLETAKKMIIKSQLKIINQEITPIPLCLVSNLFACQGPLFWFYYIFNKISKLKPSLFAYQFIFSCRS